ncbi:hypothetical protein ACP70R_042054 [Stipagrostis hirtigluma subsp. patula]
MASVATNEVAAAGGPPAAPTGNTWPVILLDPELFMAARRGDSRRLEELLFRLNGAAAATAHAVVVQVDPRPAPAPAAASTLLQLLDGVTSNEGDSLLHVVAAAGDGDEFFRCAQMIYDSKEGLLVSRNSKGDTPLHCAAAAGNANMVSRLAALAPRGSETELLRMRNKGGETALHHAVRAASKASIDRLMSMDSELACIPLADGASPLYLAISLGDMEIAQHLYDESRGRLSYSGLDGQNVLHAAVSRVQALPMLLERFRGLTVDVQEGFNHMSSVPLASHLAIQRDKQTGSTPLHLAAALEGWPDAKLLSKWFPNVWPRPKLALKMLLHANPSAAYLTDNQGLYPIHVAALSGSLDVVNIMLEECPDSATLRDAKGRTFLHVAVEKEIGEVVQYACRRMSSSVLNVQDNEGDTALHRAVDVGNLGVFNCLIRNHHVRLNIQNKEGLTPLDLSWCKLPSSWFYYDLNPRSLIQLSLQFVGASCGGSRPDLLSQKHIPKRDINKVSKHLTNAAQVMGIVSVLVATVTFASAFTLPGGYYQSGSNNAGAALLAGSYAFDAFILSDTLAFICSCIATFSLVFAGVPAMDISIRLLYFEISAVLLRSSGRSLVVAFALGLYLVLAPIDHTTAIAVCVIISISSLYGSSEAWKILAAAKTARARLGTRVPIVWTFSNAFVIVLLNFWSFIIIFGVPAIRKAVHSVVPL